jgi:uncharacterized protein (DUF433 family)
MMSARSAIYDSPGYKILEASWYLRIPYTTLRSWVVGRDYVAAGEVRRFQPAIEIADPDNTYLSFNNLVEAHVLWAIRRKHQIPFFKIRDAIDFLQRQFGTRRPLLGKQLMTDGIDLFVEKVGDLINVSRKGQMAMREVLQMHLRRIEYDKMDLPVRLYPFIHSKPDPEPTGPVVIDPNISFGRPIIHRIGVPTALIAERFNAGEKIAEIAADYGADLDDIEEAIRAESQVHAA